MRSLLLGGALAVVASAAMCPVAHAQEAVPAAPAAPAAPPDFKKAGEHYRAAEQAMTDGRYLDAARDYAIAYEITRDPILFFKIATANHKGDRCEVAITYYRRYLKEGKPDAEFKKLATERMAECEAKTGTAPERPAATGPTTTTTPPAPTTTPTTAPPATTGTQPTTTTTTSTSTSTSPTGTPETTTTTTTGTGSKLEPLPPESAPETTGAETAIAAPAVDAAAERPGWTRSAAWIAVGVAGAASTVGAVMALSASSTEQDIDDLIALRDKNGLPPTYDGTNRTRYEQLIDEGKRFNTLTIVSFGVAGAAVVTAGVLFVVGSGGDESSATALHVAPSVGPGQAGMTAGWHF